MILGFGALPPDLDPAAASANIIRGQITVLGGMPLVNEIGMGCGEAI
jgi:hypothetical protein